MKSFLKGRYIKLRGALLQHPADREILLYPGGTIHLQDLYLYFGKYTGKHTRDQTRRTTALRLVKILNTDPRATLTKTQADYS